jgi:predicted DNA-binding transcriptional regulator AlpA
VAQMPSPSKSEQMTKPRLTVPEAAEYLRLSKSWLDHKRTAGRGPRFVKLGGKIFYDVRDLDSWIETHKQNSTADRPQLPRRRRRRPNNAIDVGS